MTYYFWLGREAEEPREPFPLLTAQRIDGEMFVRAAEVVAYITSVRNAQQHGETE